MVVFLLLLAEARFVFVLNGSLFGGGGAGGSGGGTVVAVGSVHLDVGAGWDGGDGLFGGAGERGGLSEGHEDLGYKIEEGKEGHWISPG